LHSSPCPDPHPEPEQADLAACGDDGYQRDVVRLHAVQQHGAEAVDGLVMASVLDAPVDELDTQNLWEVEREYGNKKLAGHTFVNDSFTAEIHIRVRFHVKHSWFWSTVTICGRLKVACVPLRGNQVVILLQNHCIYSEPVIGNVSF
jgi:hypothetical protein